MDGDTLVVEHFESMAPVILSPRRGPMSDAEFAEFCERYQDYQVESTAEGQILIMPPNFPKTDKRNVKLVARLLAWAEANGRGDVFGPSAGFRLPNGARRSPDASWIHRERIEALPAEQQRGYYHLCPDFVVELRSTERLKQVKEKMDEYMANGAGLGWLIDPQERQVWVYRKGEEPVCLANPTELRGEGPIEGFVLDLAGILD